MSDGSHDRSEWLGCSRCPSNITRFMPSIPGYVYASEGIIFANLLYMGNEGQITLEGQMVRIKQETCYPCEGRIVDFGSPPVFVYSGFAYSRLGTTATSSRTLYTYLDKDTTSYTISLNGKR